MQARNCRERILSLKQWRLDKGLTVDQCAELCGDFPSEYTVRKIFAKGSEDKTFRESTVAAVELACLGHVYEPALKIPVEDVVRAQEDTARRFAQEVRALRHTVERQAHLIHSLLSICVISVLFFGGIALYDFFSHSTGFWNTDSYPIWIAKVAFLLYLAFALVRWFVVLRRIKARFAAEEQAAAESGI